MGTKTKKTKEQKEVEEQVKAERIAAQEKKEKILGSIEAGMSKIISNPNLSAEQKQEQLSQLYGGYSEYFENADMPPVLYSGKDKDSRAKQDYFAEMWIQTKKSVEPDWVPVTERTVDTPKSGEGSSVNVHVTNESKNPYGTGMTGALGTNASDGTGAVGGTNPAATSGTATKPANNSYNLDKSLQNAADKAGEISDAYADRAENNINGLKDKYEAETGVNAHNGEIEKDNLIKHGKSAIDSGIAYKNAIDSDAEVKDLREQQATIKAGQKGNKLLDKKVTPFKGKVSGWLDNAAANLMTSDKVRAANPTPDFGVEHNKLEQSILENPEILKNDETVKQYAETSSKVADMSLEELGPLVEQFGSKEDMEDYQALLKAKAAVNKMQEGGVNPEDAAEALKNVKQQIKDEINSDPEILAAKDEHQKQIFDLMYYTLDTMISLTYSYVALANGNFQPLYSQIMQRNQSYTKAETKYKTDLLNSFASANNTEINRDAEVATQVEQAYGEINKALMQAGLDQVLDANNVAKLYNEYQQYQKYLATLPADQAVTFAAWYNKKNTGNSVLSTIISVLSALPASGNGKMAEIIQGLLGIVGGNPDNAAAPAPTGDPVSMVDTKGKVGSWMDNAMNNSKTPVTDPSVSLDKQNTLAMAQQNVGGGQVPQGQPQAQGNPGWGGTQQA